MAILGHNMTSYFCLGGNEQKNLQIIQEIKRGLFLGLISQKPRKHYKTGDLMRDRNQGPITMALSHSCSLHLLLPSFSVSCLVCGRQLSSISQATLSQLM